MSRYTMDQYTLQSYFKSLCNNFCIAYAQVKRLEKKKEELKNSFPNEEMKLVDSLLKISVSEELEQKYMTPKYSKEELEKRKEELKVANKKKYDENCEELVWPKQFWSQILWNISAESIVLVLKQIKVSNFSVIVTSKEEIIALMAFFREYPVEKYKIINTDEQYLKFFPTGEKMYEEFLQAYLLEVEADAKGIHDGSEPMKKVIEKYF